MWPKWFIFFFSKVDLELWKLNYSQLSSEYYDKIKGRASRSGNYSHGSQIFNLPSGIYEKRIYFRKEYSSKVSK